MFSPHSKSYEVGMLTNHIVALIPHRYVYQIFTLHSQCYIVVPVNYISISWGNLQRVSIAPRVKGRLRVEI